MSNESWKPREPVIIDCAFEEPDRIRELVRRGGPYWPTLRYVANQSELSAFGSGDRQLAIIPWFRSDWAYGKALVEGADEVLNNKAFVDAAHTLFGAEVVNSQIVYVNVMGPMGVGPAHIDVPAFRGIDRTDFPVTFLHLMHRSGLFESHRVAIATAVSWFYEGGHGEFEYWPDGVEAPSKRIEAPLSNRAVVGDNEIMFHRVAKIGESKSPIIQGASLDVELVADSEGSEWAAIEKGRELARYTDRDVRVSVSWKAEVFADGEAARVRADRSDDLRLDDVVDALLSDLAEKGHRGLAKPADPVRDESFIRILNETYPVPIPSGVA